MDDIEEHYSDGGLSARVLGALRELHGDLDALSVEDLAPVDEFHTRGRHATRELAELAGIEPGTRLLDVGSGLGGPARFLATECGCDVTGVDLVAEFCQLATELTRLTRLEQRVRFHQASALSLPFDDASFDAVWTMQAQMNIADKRGFYSEIARVLRPGGRFIFQDIVTGNGEPLDFPVPWATEPSQSHLVPPGELRALLGELGLTEQTWRDVSDSTRAWRAAHPAPTAPPRLGTHLVMGDRAADKRKNSAGNLAKGRIAFVQGVFAKP